MSMKMLDTINFIKEKTILTKSDMADLTKLLSSFVTEGDANPVDTYVLLDFVEKAFSSAKDAIKPQAIKNVKAGDFEGYGVNLNLSRKGSFDYKYDKDWKRITEQLATIGETRKAREKTLKAEAEEALAQHTQPPIPVHFTDVIRVDYQE